MIKKALHKKLFTRRALILAAAKTTLAAGLLGRMFYLQVIKSEGFSQLSEKNRIKTESLAPIRGRILDRNTIVLATNEHSYQLIFGKPLDYTLQELEDAAKKISEFVSFSNEQHEELLDNFKNLRLDEELIVVENLTWQQLVKLEFHLYDIEGSSIETGFNRSYPYGALCGHLTGYIGSISKNETEANSPILYPNFKIGKNGIEKTQEKLLHGIAGVRRTEINAKSEMIQEISTTKSTTGQDINLTIDIDLQKKASLLLGSVTGVVMVLKIHTGEIITSYSSPNFDPNLFNYGISQKNWNNLIYNPELPLIDRSVAMTYPPGSGFKVIVAIAATKNNFDPETKFYCPGYHTVGNRIFRCWKRSGHGSINLYEAIAQSCNVYFWNVAQIIGIQPIADMARIMGYDHKLLNNELPREQVGIIPDPEWKFKNIGSKWTLADTINTAIGQGYVEATPLQILTAASRVASGKKVMPSIIKNEIPLEFEPLNLDQELKTIHKGMTMAVNSRKGTAYKNRILINDIAMAGKTSTSQVISKRHKDDNLSHESVKKTIKNHGIFTAYAPLINPQYAYCGVIEHGGSPSLAIKIARELLTQAQLTKI